MGHVVLLAVNCSPNRNARSESWLEWLEYGNDWLTNLRGNSQFLPIHDAMREGGEGSEGIVFHASSSSHLEHFAALSVCVAVFLFPPKSFHPCLEKQQISRPLPFPSRIPGIPPLPNASRPRRESCLINSDKCERKGKIIFKFLAPVQLVLAINLLFANGLNA